MIRNACWTVLGALLLTACASKPPEPPFPAFLQVGELSDVFLASLPGVRAKPLAGDPQTRRMGNRIDLPAAWKGTSGGEPGRSMEIFVLQGDLSLADIELGPGGYAFLPAGSLGFIPTAVGRDSGQDILDYLSGRPKSAFGEAIRTLHWSVSLAFPDRSVRTVLITSSHPSEGKTSVASCLAWVQSRAGQNVLLIDADTRRPSVHKLVRVKRRPGLLDVLAGTASLDEAIRGPETSGFCVLPAGSPTTNVPSLLGSERMSALLAEVAGRFDLVIIDSPPVMAAADARILTSKVDATVMVARWARTPREAVRLSLRQLDAAGGRLAGVLLTMVDVRKHAQYSYGDSGAYTGALEKYYAG